MLTEQTKQKIKADADSLLDQLGMSPEDRVAATAMGAVAVDSLTCMNTPLFLLGKNPEQVHKLKTAALALALQAMQNASVDVPRSGEAR